MSLEQTEKRYELDVSVFYKDEGVDDTQVTDVVNKYRDDRTNVSDLELMEMPIDAKYTDMVIVLRRLFTFFDLSEQACMDISNDLVDSVDSNRDDLMIWIHLYNTGGANPMQFVRHTPRRLRDDIRVLEQDSDNIDMSKVHTIPIEDRVECKH